MLTRFYNGRIIQGDKIIDELWVKDGFVINPSKEIPNDIFDLNGQYLAPGFIDLQINGGYGIDFTSNLEDVSFVAKKLLQKGVVAFLPTIISSAPDLYQKIKTFNPKEGGHEGASILGLHLEGPFLNPLQAGAHNKNNLLTSEGKSLEEVYSSLDHVKMVTLAPEIKGALEMIKKLKEYNIVIACGHSQASSDILKEAITQGLTVITHLYNAMPSFHHRISSIVETAFSEPDLYFSMIVDGVHVSKTGVKIAFKMNPGGLFLVSDAVSLMETDIKKMLQAEVMIQTERDKALVIETGRLAGGLVALDENVRHLISMTECSIEYAIEAASEKPAKILGIDHLYGSLKVGRRADMIILNDQLEVQSTFIKGEKVYIKSTATLS